MDPPLTNGVQDLRLGEFNLPRETVLKMPRKQNINLSAELVRSWISVKRAAPVPYFVDGIGTASMRTIGGGQAP